MMRTIIVILALLPVSYAQKINFSPLPESAVVERREPVPALPNRQARLEELFRQAGCRGDAITEQKIDSLSEANVICSLPGKSHEVIIIGANYGQSPPDNWNAAALLPSIYQALTRRKRKHTFLFIAFADENRTLGGSEFFVTHLDQALLDHTEAMVNLDAMGFSPTKVSTQHSDPELTKDLITTVYLLKRSIGQVDLSRAVKTDSESFVARNIPRITLHSLTLPDVMDPPEAGPSSLRRFQPDNYYSSYYLVSGFLAYLDVKLKSRHHK